MSISTPKQVLGRIQVARPHSPIAVFTHPDKGLLQAFFLTTTTKAMIEAAPDLFIGTYHAPPNETEEKRLLLKLMINAKETET